LICDDDPDIRAAMRRTLRGHEIYEASSPREGLDALKARKFDAVVSDYSMDAESDGLDFLQLVKLQYPDTIRFLVTANRDLDVVVRAVNEGAVHRYFLKPWNDEKLRSALDIVLRSKVAKPPSE
jgi:DNA-binding NtrC family response regulator